MLKFCTYCYFKVNQLDHTLILPNDAEISSALNLEDGTSAQHVFKGLRHEVLAWAAALVPTSCVPTAPC